MDAVEVHRVRRVAQVVEVLEVDAQQVADPRVNQRTGDQKPVGALSASRWPRRRRQWAL